MRSTACIFIGPLRFQVDTTVLGLDAAAAKEQPYIASMGIYVLKASAIRELLLKYFPQVRGGLLQRCT